jgi:hypothetical protein
MRITCRSHKERIVPQYWYISLIGTRAHSFDLQKNTIVQARKCLYVKYIVVYRGTGSRGTGFRTDSRSVNLGSDIGLTEGDCVIRFRGLSYHDVFKAEMPDDARYRVKS